MDFFQKGGFSRTFFIFTPDPPLPLTTTKGLYSGSDLPARAIPFRGWVTRHWSQTLGVWDKADQNQIGEIPARALRMPPLLHAPSLPSLPRPCPITPPSQSPCPKDRRGTREGGGVMLMGPVSHPRLSELHCPRSNWRRSTQRPLDATWTVSNFSFNSHRVKRTRVKRFSISRW